MMSLACWNTVFDLVDLVDTHTHAHTHTHTLFLFVLSLFVFFAEGI